MLVRIVNRKIGITDYISCCNFLWSNSIYDNALCVFSVKSNGKLLEVQDYFGYVFFDARTCAELMKNSLDLYGSNRSTRKGAKKDSSQAIAKSKTISSLKRLNNKFSISPVIVCAC